MKFNTFFILFRLMVKIGDNWMKMRIIRISFDIRPQQGRGCDPNGDRHLRGTASHSY